VTAAAGALAGAQPVAPEPVSTAADAPAAQPVAAHGGTDDDRRGHGDAAAAAPENRSASRVIVTAALAGAALAGGLAWLVSPGAAAGATTIAITAHHSRFEPDRVTVKPNSTVRFVVHNADPIDHEFIIGPPETHALHERGTPHVHTGVTPGEITVPAGATVETSWTFGPSGSPGVAYGCHLAGHWNYGMHGLAVIR
jgi:uncharacterized cupredoxin-like copper-binding protein